MQAYTRVHKHTQHEEQQEARYAVLIKCEVLEFQPSTLINSYIWEPSMGTLTAQVRKVCLGAMFGFQEEKMLKIVIGKLENCLYEERFSFS